MTVSWATLFDRADGHEVTVGEIRDELDRRRDSDAGEPSGETDGDGSEGDAAEDGTVGAGSEGDAAEDEPDAEGRRDG